LKVFRISRSRFSLSFRSWIGFTSPPTNHLLPIMITS
jgi:hypothetical protein